MQNAKQTLGRTKEKPRSCGAGSFFELERIEDQRDNGIERPFQEEDHCQDHGAEDFKQSEKEVTPEKEYERDTY